MHNFSNILSLPETGFCYLIANCNIQWITSASMAFDAAVVNAECKNPQVAKHVHTIQSIFNCINAGWLCYETYKLGRVLISNYSVGLISPYTGVGLLACMAAVVAYKKIFATPLCPEALNENMSMKRPWMQSIAQCMYVARTVLNVSLACLSPTGQWNFAFNAVCAAWSYRNLSGLKWLRVEMGEDYVHEHIKKIKFTYHSLLIAAGNKQKDNCTICLEANNSSSAYFCENHIYHIDCLAGWIREKTPIIFKEITPKITDYFRDGRFDHRSYHLTIPENHLPGCPNCQVRPKQAKIDAHVTDRIYQGCPTAVSLSDQRKTSPLFSKSFFERMNLLYAGFQTGVALIQQRRFELMDSCLRFQRFMLPLDIANLAYDLFALYNELKEKARPENRRKLNVVFGMGCCVGGAVGAVAIMALNRFMAPILDPKQLVIQALSLSTREAANFSMSWRRGILDQVVQWTILCRLAVHMGSIAVTKHRFSRLLNSALLAATLTKMAQVPWLLLSIRPDAGMPSGISQLHAHFYFVIPPSSLQGQDPQPFKGIYEYASNYFKNSAWSSYWVITNNGGVVTRSLHFTVRVLPKKLFEFCKEAVLPYFDGVVGSAVHQFNGVGTLHVVE